MDALNKGFTVDLGIYGIIIAVYAAVVLILAILAVAALFRQKKLLTQINNTLMRQGAPAAPSYTPPAPNTCLNCGTVHAPGAGFCQNCGAALQ